MRHDRFHLEDLLYHAFCTVLTLVAVGMAFICVGCASEHKAARQQLMGKWVCVGASITVGEKATRPELGYVGRLREFARRDGIPVEIINEGRSGWSTGAYAFNADKLAKKIPTDTSLITILLGTNDIREKKQPETIAKEARKNLQKLMNAYRAQAPQARIILITLTAVYPQKFTPALRAAGYDDAGPEKLRAINAEIKSLAQQANLQCIDVSALPDEADSVEGVHPGDAGHAKLAELIWREVQNSWVESGN